MDDEAYDLGRRSKKKITIILEYASIQVYFYLHRSNAIGQSTSSFDRLNTWQLGLGNIPG